MKSLAISRLSTYFAGLFFCENCDKKKINVTILQRFCYTLVTKKR